MKREAAVSARIVLVLVVGAAVLLAAGCGGDKKRMVGTWALDLSAMKLDPAKGEYSLTWTFDRDGTGTMKVHQTVMPEAPADQTISFAWELKEDKLVMSGPGMGQQEMKFGYEFGEKGELLLKAGRQPAQRLVRVE